MDLAPADRTSRTPASDAERLFEMLFRVYAMKRGDRDDLTPDFLRIVERARESYGAASRGDRLAEMFKIGEDSDPTSDQYIEVALGYCVDAIFAASSERTLAWTYVIDGTGTLGLAMVASQKEVEAEERTARLSNSRHAENRAMRAEAEEWYRAHRGPGMTKDRAAELIATKVVPAKYRTVRAWLSAVKD